MSTGDNATPPNGAYVVDKDGVRGWIQDSGELPPETALTHVSVRTDDGSRLLVARELLAFQTADTYAIPASFAELKARHLAAPFERPVRLDEGSDAGAVKHLDAIVVPVLSEELVVTKRPAVVGRIRLTKRVRTHEQVVDETVQVERTHVERVPINRIVEAAPGIRYEGDTMVISVVEEVLVVEKRLMLREELHVTKQQLREPVREKVVLRSEEITVERFEQKDLAREEPT